MRILITGAAGFLGFCSAVSLLKKEHIIYGIDSFDNYYSIKLKKKRIKELKNYKNFYFKRIDISKKKKLENFLNNKKIDVVIHFAAQAGVRYSYINPSKYISANFFGFLNLILASKKNKIKKIIYASSSSVYGDSKTLPVDERSKLNKKNIYSVTKCLNEDTAKLYNKLYGINFVGLRFFTIFGEWGRPDMLIFKIFKSQIEKKILKINNYGNHYRDFTYIGDVRNIINRLVYKKINGHEIFNLCSNNPISILDLIKNFKKNYNLKVKFTPLHKADVINTHGNNKKIKKFLKIKKFSNFYTSFYKTFDWYKKNKINKIS